jgi:hypothetical protein
MYCPSCGSEERQATQFCRACGVDLRTVRVGLEHPDAITASAVSAREEIGRAVAQKIREIEDPHELRSVTASVLPEIEKFLESHEEKRLRRLRTGMITALVGLGLGVPALVFTSVYTNQDIVGYLGLALILAAVTFATGLGLLVNGLIFTKPRPGLQDNSSGVRIQNLLDKGLGPPQLRLSSEAQPLVRAATTSNLTQAPGSSVTEHTTHHLKTEG